MFIDAYKHQIADASQSYGMDAADIDKDGDMDVVRGTSFITAEYMPPNLTNLIQTLQVLCEIWQPQGTELLDMNENDRVDLIDAMGIIHSMSSQ